MAGWCVGKMVVKFKRRDLMAGDVRRLDKAGGRSAGTYIQVNCLGKGVNQTTLPAVLVRVSLNEQGFGVARRRSGTIREDGFPRLHVLRREELDVGEKMLPGTRNPGLGNETTLERISFLVWKVNVVIQQFRRVIWV